MLSFGNFSAIVTLQVLSLDSYHVRVMRLSEEILVFLYNSATSLSTKELVERIPVLDILLATTLLERLEEKGLIIKSGEYWRISEKGIETIREKKTG